MSISESEAAVDEPLNEGSFDKVEQGNYSYLPFDFIELVLMSAHNN
jgi:hypothetical protein